MSNPAPAKGGHGYQHGPTEHFPTAWPHPEAAFEVTGVDQDGAVTSVRIKKP